jgi:hypothetical protein
LGADTIAVIQSNTVQAAALPMGQTMSKEELKRVTSGCLAALTGIIQSGMPAPSDQMFVNYLVTATLCLGLAPRSQVMRQLQIGTTLVKQADGRYWVRMLAEMSKNGKPTMFALPEQLTPAYDSYLAVVRPRLLAGTRVAVTHDYVFFKRNGVAPRPDFGSSTAFVTQQLIGRPINPHAFRSAVITTFYETGATQVEMDTLANIMAHDPSTARQFYYKPVLSQAALQTSQRMVQQLLA